MANNWFQKMISPYARQLQRQDSPRAMQISLGTNVPATWDSEDKLWFIAEYKVPILPASGGVIGNHGQNIVYGLPLSVEPTWEVIMHDYDIDVRQRLLEYAAARTKMRFWAWGVFVAVGYVANVVIQMPLDNTLAVSFVIEGCRLLKASAHNQDVVDFDTSTPIHMVDMPFALSAAAVTTYQTHSILYGTEILP
jgi:hypothetical protein